MKEKRPTKIGSVQARCRFCGFGKKICTQPPPDHWKGVGVSLSVYKKFGGQNRNGTLNETSSNSRSCESKPNVAFSFLFGPHSQSTKFRGVQTEFWNNLAVWYRHWKNNPKEWDGVWGLFIDLQRTKRQCGVRSFFLICNRWNDKFAHGWIKMSLFGDVVSPYPRFGRHGTIWDRDKRQQYCWRGGKP